MLSILPECVESTNVLLLSYRLNYIEQEKNVWFILPIVFFFLVRNIYLK